MFLSELGLAKAESGGVLQDQEVIQESESYVSKIFQASGHLPQHEFYYNQERGVQPYAAVFIMFVCGQHKTALRYARQYCDSDSFCALYDDYFINHEGKGLPRAAIERHYRALMHSGSDMNNERALQHDEYRNLLVHIMIGCIYKQEDQQFIESVLFGNNSLQMWT